MQTVCNGLRFSVICNCINIRIPFVDTLFNNTYSDIYMCVCVYQRIALVPPNMGWPAIPKPKRLHCSNFGKVK